MLCNNRSEHNVLYVFSASCNIAHLLALQFVVVVHSAESERDLYIVVRELQWIGSSRVTVQRVRELVTQFDSFSILYMAL